MAEAMFWMQAMTLLVSILILVTGLVALHKVRKIHVRSYQIATDASEARKEAGQLFTQLQALNELDRTLELTWPLPPLRGWVGSPDFLLTVAERVLNGQPKTVVECSSGVSTLVVSRCLQKIGSGHVYSLEHDEEYAEKTRNLLAKYRLEEWATVLHSPLVSVGEGAPWYDESVLPGGLPPIELLVVDGPPLATAPLARLPALPRLLPRMAECSVVILDDADRPEETEIVKRWVEYAPEFRVTYLNHEKGCAILEREGSEPT